MSKMIGKMRQKITNTLTLRHNVRHFHSMKYPEHLGLQDPGLFTESESYHTQLKMDL